jgi:hypothetical protein
MIGRWVSIAAISFAVLFASVVTASAQDGAGGVKVRDGGTITGDAEGRARTQARANVTPICTALRTAARQPGRKFKGPPEFVGHAPWVAELICQFVDKAAPNPNNGAPAFDDPAERRRFVGAVLDAIEANARVSTRQIARARILTGETMYRLHIRQRFNERAEYPRPEAVPRMDIARSIENPDELLLGMATKNFRVEGNNLVDWIKAGEVFVLRAHALAESGRLLIERGIEWPVVDMGPTVTGLSRAFQDAHSLKNTAAQAQWKEIETKAEEATAENEQAARQREAQAGRDGLHVSLQIDRTRSQIPVARAEGLSYFEYAPMAGPEAAGGANTRRWFIQRLAKGADGHEAGGITLPMWRFQELAVEALPFPDRLFDETTRAPVETRLTLLASCVVRLHYYRLPTRDKRNPDRLTNLVAAHERKHFDGIRNAWIDRTQRLRGDLEGLATSMSTALGLAGDEAFRFEGSTLTDTWRMDRSNADTINATAIPQGLLRPTENAGILHSNPRVQILRLRLVRRIAAEQAGATLVEMLQSKAPLDPKLDAITKEWSAWLDAHRHEFRNGFVRQFLRAAIELDAAEGVIEEAGQSGRPDLRGVLLRFDAATDPNDPKKAKLDPQRELDKILPNPR